MKDYNGFPAEFRTAVYGLQKSMGLMVPVTRSVCSMCHQRGGFIMGHTENYYDLYDLRPICVECHMKLHARFSRPGVWIHHLSQLAAGRHPFQWVSTQQYFGAQAQNNELYLELAKESPLLFGNEWYHQLLMKKIDLYSKGDRKLPMP